MIDPVELDYDIQPLPPGVVGFRRWRWELWHGPRMLAAGWRVSALHAQRALRTHAVRYVHRLHGLHLLRPTVAVAPEVEWRTQPVVVEWGELQVVLSRREPRVESSRLAEVIPLPRQAPAE